ncbi:MAG: hypothetical protein WC107_00910 [Patescibacteria group bacterium]
MSKEEKGKKNYTHEKRHTNLFIKKRVEQKQDMGNDNMMLPATKKHKS